MGLSYSILAGVTPHQTIRLHTFFLPRLPPYLPDTLCDSTEIISRQWTPFEEMTGRKVFINLIQVFLNRKVNARRSVYSPRFNLIITLIISLQT